jgi:hypothetical protein
MQENKEMKQTGFLIIAYFVLSLPAVHAQKVELSSDNLKAVNSMMSLMEMDGKEVVRVVKDTAVKEFDEPTYARTKNLDFADGTIEVKVMSRLLPDAPDFARGFIGVAFRINEDNSKYECFYIRPTNGRADNQVRRNHSMQYYAYPDFKFDRLRKDSPETYESYADMGLNEWITMKIEVKGEKAKLFINDNKQPSLIVNDLKLGGKTQGGIGFFVDTGTEGFFKDLDIRNTKRYRMLTL